MSAQAINKPIEKVANDRFITTALAKRIVDAKAHMKI
jgi:hypothetical protein